MGDAPSCIGERVQDLDVPALFDDGEALAVREHVARVVRLESQRRRRGGGRVRRQRAGGHHHGDDRDLESHAVSDVCRCMR